MSFAHPEAEFRCPNRSVWKALGDLSKVFIGSRAGACLAVTVRNFQRRKRLRTITFGKTATKPMTFRFDRSA
jgi:hypothetical protein